MRFLEAQVDFSERGCEVLPRDIDFLRDGRNFFLCHPLEISISTILEDKVNEVRGLCNGKVTSCLSI